jgi:hypothetical protein
VIAFVTGTSNFTENPYAKGKLMRYKVIHIISVLLLVLGVAMVILAILEGEKSVFQSIGAGGAPIAVGGGLFGLSARLKRKHIASGTPANQREN